MPASRIACFTLLTWGACAVQLVVKKSLPAADNTYDWLFDCTVDLKSFHNLGVIEAVEFLQQASALDMLSPDLLKNLSSVNNPVNNQVAPNAPWLMIRYHKTGMKVAKSLSYYNAEAFRHGKVDEMSASARYDDPFFRPYWTSPVELKEGGVAMMASPSSGWELPANARVVAWVRDPVALILSAYRYHANAISAELWESLPRVCHMCGKREHSMIFNISTCDPPGVCTEERRHPNYFQLLSSLQEDDGVVVEAMHRRRTIEVMLENFVRWRDQPNVLHLSLEHLQKDYNGTMQCLMKFLGVEVTESVMDGLSVFNIDGSANQACENQRHRTHLKYDNKGIQSSLVSNARWRKQFKVAQDALQRTFLRENQLYGCPIPDLPHLTG